MGKKIKRVGRSPMAMVPAVLGLLSTLIITFFLFAAPTLIQNSETVRFEGDIRILYIAGLFTFLLFMMFVIFFIWSTPKYRIVIYQDGVEVKRKGKVENILYTEIEDFIEVPHWEGFSMAAAFKRKDDKNWFYMDIRNSITAIPTLTETYSSAVYPSFKEKLDAGQALNFKYYSKKDVLKRKIRGGKLEKYLNAPMEKLTFDKQKLTINEDEILISNIASIHFGKLTSKTKLISLTGDELWSFTPYAISNELVFLKLISDMIDEHSSK